MNSEDAIWDDYRRRQREIRERIESLKDEEAKLFRSTLQRIQDLNPPTHTVGSEFAGALGNKVPTSKEPEACDQNISEDDREAEFTRASNPCPNCS